MSACAAVLVDAENISGKQHMLNVHQFLQTTCLWYQAQIVEFAVHGNIHTHRWWKHSAYHISYYMHHGGKNAADEQIRWHASMLVEQGISLFYVVSNDKDLAVVADLLETSGCTVFCLGTRLASHILRGRKNFFRLDRLDQRITLRSSVTVLSNPPLEGVTMSKSYYTQVAPNTEFLTSQERVEQALQVIYQRSQLPDFYPRFLSLFLEWAILALCVLDQDIISTPGEIAEVLKEMEQDLFLSAGMTEEGKSHWKATYAFAKRCEYVYVCGCNDAARLINRTPHMTTAVLRQAALQKNGHDWEYLFSADLPQEQQAFFRAVERTEQMIWSRWYERGREQGVRAGREARQEAWVAPVSDTDR